MNIKKKAVNSTQLNIGGKIVVDDKEVASHFNKFFVNVGPSTAWLPHIPIAKIQPKMVILTWHSSNLATRMD